MYLLRGTNPGRIALAAGIVALAAVVGLLAGKATDGEEATSKPAADQPLPVVPEGETTLSRELEALGAARVAGLNQLRAAPTASRQATASRALVRTYLRAATELARPDPLSGLTPVGEPVAEALRRAATAYRRLAAAAARADRSLYEAARRAVRSAEVLLARRLGTNLTQGGVG